MTPKPQIKQPVIPPLAQAVEARLRQQLAEAKTPQERAHLKAALDELPNIVEAGQRIKRMSRAELEREYACRCAEVVKLTAYLRRVHAVIEQVTQEYVAWH